MDSFLGFLITIACIYFYFNFKKKQKIRIKKANQFKSQTIQNASPINLVLETVKLEKEEEEKIINKSDTLESISISDEIKPEKNVEQLDTTITVDDDLKPLIDKEFENNEKLYLFEDKYEEKAENKYDEFVNLIYKIEDCFSLSERINLCKKSISKFDKWKDFCLSKGIGGELYYNNCFLDNQKLLDFENINNLYAELDFLQNNPVDANEKMISLYMEYNGIETRQEYDEEMEYELLCKNLKKDMKLFIVKNNGILNKDIPPHFDSRLKNKIPGCLKELIEEDKIYREKSGNSFKLYIKK